MTAWSPGSPAAKCTCCRVIRLSPQSWINCHAFKFVPWMTWWKLIIKDLNMWEHAAGVTQEGLEWVIKVYYTRFSISFCVYRALLFNCDKGILTELGDRSTFKWKHDRGCLNAGRQNIRNLQDLVLIINIQQNHSATELVNEPTTKKPINQWEDWRLTLGRRDASPTSSISTSTSFMEWP